MYAAGRMGYWLRADCWDCEVQTTYGWIECAGLADRSAFDLSVHSKASKTELVAYEQFDAPREEEVVEVEPQMKVMGKTLKQAAKAVVEHLAGLSDYAALALKVRSPLRRRRDQRTLTASSLFVTWWPVARARRRHDHREAVGSALVLGGLGIISCEAAAGEGRPRRSKSVHAMYPAACTAALTECMRRLA